MHRQYIGGLIVVEQFRKRGTPCNIQQKVTHPTEGSPLANVWCGVVYSASDVFRPLNTYRYARVRTTASSGNSLNSPQFPAMFEL